MARKELVEELKMVCASIGFVQQKLQKSKALSSQQADAQLEEALSRIHQAKKLLGG